MRRISWVPVGLMAIVGTFASLQVVSAEPLDQVSIQAAQAAQTGTASDERVGAVVEVLKYNRAIHVMAMLLIGFGFLMVFVRGYGLSAVTATYLMTAAGIPVYMLIKSLGVFGETAQGIDAIILSEFAVASLLICAGALLGRLKMWQYIVLAVLFIPAYMINEWIVLGRAFGLVERFADTGGSIVIHAFGALFGLGAAVSLTSVKERDIEIRSDFTSDRFSMLGSMVLWVFWPSFCAALVSPELIPLTVTNVVLALCGSTLATYFISVALRKHIGAADIANATLAGGVAIGSTCDATIPSVAMLIGIVAGAASTFGFAIIQTRLEKIARLRDTCGVSNLHGIPGLLGGLAALLVVSGINAGAQLIGIGVTIGIALTAGIISGKLISLFGRRTQPNEDIEEFDAYPVER